MEDASSGTREKSEAGSKDANAAKAGEVGKATRIPRGYGKIVRDEKGNVVDVILDEADDASPATAMELENELDRRQPESLPGADWLLKGEAGMELDVVRGACHTIITAMGTNVLHDVRAKLCVCLGWISTRRQLERRATEGCSDVERRRGQVPAAACGDIWGGLRADGQGPEKECAPVYGRAAETGDSQGAASIDTTAHSVVRW